MKDRRGVSPIIGTILMVALTVVLAGVLYVMVTGFVVTSEPPPYVVLMEPYQTSSGNWIFDLTGVSPVVELSSFEAMVRANGTTVLETATVQVGAISSSGGLILKFVDLNGNRMLSSGDYFFLVGTDASTSYKLAITWKASNAMVAEAEVVP